ncbi:MAG: hypothetical protein ACXVQU_01380 [Actinomycetota bacterium]
MPGFGDGGPWGGPGAGHPLMGGPGPGHPGWVPFVWGLLPALVFGGLIALVVFLFLRMARERSWSPATAAAVGGDQAFVEARMRYARGELARDDYLRISRDLGHDVAASDAPTATATTSEPPQPPPATTPERPEPPSAE